MTDSDRGSAMSEDEATATNSSMSVVPLHVSCNYVEDRGMAMEQDRRELLSVDEESTLVTATCSAPSTSHGSLEDDLTMSFGRSSLHRNHRRPNLELTEPEKSAKRLLKKHLKQRTKLRKYETRLQQAVVRHDKVLNERAQQEWKDYMRQLQDDPESIINYTTSSRSQQGTVEGSQSIICPRPVEQRETERVGEGRKWIIKLWQGILPTIMQATDKLLSTHGVECFSIGDRSRISMLRQQQTDQARQLLQNMTKGTQTELMFTNELALAGYARQKFVERAVLAFSILDSLDPKNHATKQCAPGCKGCTGDNTDMFWKRLMLVTQVWSIGCGPGCDAIGILAFMESHNLNLANGILLMDFVIDQWKGVILNQLIPYVSPRYVSSVETEFCDVRYSLKTDQVNSRAMKSVKQFLHECRPKGMATKSVSRLVAVSYLLTETRHQWKAFFRDLLKELQGTQTLFLLSEPTAWQLHDFLKLFGDDFLQAHMWLDSSRDTPHLQTLEARLGPAALMVCTN